MKTDLFNKLIGGLFKAAARFTEEDTDTVSFDFGSRYGKGLFYGKKGEWHVFLQESGQDVTRDFSRWLHEKGLSSKEVAVSLKGDDTLIRYIPFPKMDKKGIKEAFEYEVGKYIPFSSQDVYFDVDVVDDNYSPKEFLVLLAVVKKDFLERIISSFAEEKIKVSGVTLNSVALINLFLERYSSGGDTAKNVAVVDIGFGSTLLDMFKGKIPCLSREIKISGRDFISRLAEAKNISFEDAEKWIIECGVSEEDGNTSMDVAADVFLDLSDEIKSSFDYFELNWAGGVDRVYLTGGLAGIKGVRETLEKNLNTPVEVWSVFSGEGAGEEIGERRNLFAVAAGARL